LDLLGACSYGAIIKSQWQNVLQVSHCNSDMIIDADKRLHWFDDKIKCTCVWSSSWKMNIGGFDIWSKRKEILRID
jgi:hypothetical protein